MALRNSISAVLLAAATWTGAADVPAPASRDLLAALRSGGHVIVFRHGATHADQADTDPLNPDNVDQQRQLNDRGRQLAREIGESFRKARIPVGEVRTSNFNRAYETGMLAFGKAAKTVDVTEGGLVVTPNENNRRTAALRRIAGTMPAAGTNTVVVTHKPNILDAFGKDWFEVKEGEASIFKVDAEGKYHLAGRVLAEDWGKLAAAP